MKKCIAVIFMVILLFALTACGDSEAVKVENATPGSNITEEKTTDETVFQVGETAKLNDVYVSLVAVTESTGSQYNKPEEGNVFVLCEFIIENNSDEELAVSSIMSFSGYCDDYACEYSLSALLEKGDKNQLDGSVATGKKMDGVIGFEVPVDWKELEVHYTPDLFDGTEIVFVATNN